MSLEVLFHFTSEDSYVSAEGKLLALSAIVADIAPHLIEAHIEKEQVEGIIKDGGTAYTRETPIPSHILESMPIDVRAYAKAFMTLRLNLLIVRDILGTSLIHPESCHRHPTSCSLHVTINCTTTNAT